MPEDPMIVFVCEHGAVKSLPAVSENYGEVRDAILDRLNHLISKIRRHP